MSQTVTHEGKLLENFVGGRGVGVETDEILDVLDPANGEVLARVPLSTSADVDRAVRAAAAAYETWRDVPVMERARLMFRVQQLCERHLDELGELVVRENGKSIGEGTVSYTHLTLPTTPYV